MTRHRERGPGHELDDLLGDLPEHAQCRHACHCGCHYPGKGHLKHGVACTSCTACGKGHVGIAVALLQEHLRACHPTR